MDIGYVTVNQLLEFGVPRALFWNAANRDLPIPAEEMIIRGLSRGYNERIIGLFIDYFGSDSVEDVFESKRGEISERFYEAVKAELLKRGKGGETDAPL